MADIAVADLRAKVLSPPQCHGMVKLDKARLSKHVQLKALAIRPQLCKKFMSVFKSRLLNLPRCRNVVDCPNDPALKHLLLCPSVASLDDLTDAQQAALLEEGTQIVDHTMEFGFMYWTSEQILRAALGELDEITTSFETIGHIAHMNLRDEQLPHKELIGEVILEKNKSIRTVVNKSASIDTVYRFFQMELIAGVEDYTTTVKESNCSFRMEYNKVYWNSRLHTEHDRVVGMLREGDVVLDMMAGIGPFALPAAKNKSCKVYANDLNPASYAALTENIELNKVKRFVTASNQDARVFAREVVSKTPLDSPDHPPSVFHHAVMNLPATATEFLDVFRGLFADRRDSLTPEDLPQIHCYCFSKEEAGEAGVGHDYAVDAIHLCEVGLGGPIDPAHCAVHEVRDVAPRKRMMCVSFRLPAAIAFNAAPIDLDAAASLKADLVATTEVEMSASDGDSTTCESRPTKKPRLDAP